MQATPTQAPTMPSPMPRRALLLLLAAAAQPGDADVIAVIVRRTAPGIYDFDVTIRSRDTGWEQYADLIEILAPDGTILGRRELLHPHDDEQPFTRDAYDIHIPANIHKVTVRARLKPTGFGGRSMETRLD